MRRSDATHLDDHAAAPVQRSELTAALPATEASARAPRSRQRQRQHQRTVDLRESIYRDAVAIVEAEYPQDLYLDDVAHRVASSRRQLQRCYAEIGNTTFRPHLTGVRMQRAAELLATTNLSVDEIARSVGYSQPAQFAKTFRVYQDVSPSAFRTHTDRQREAAPRAAIAPDAIDRRLTYLLRLCDRDHDDVLDAHDVEEWVDRAAALRGWEPDCEGHRALTALFVDQLYGRMHATRGRRDGRMTLPDMCDTLRAITRSQPAQAIAWAEAIFDLLDADGSGYIGLEQYRDLLSSLGVPRSVADTSFARLDARGRGRLSRSEFRALYLRFFRDEDPDTTAAWLWGPPSIQHEPAPT